MDWVKGIIANLIGTATLRKGFRTYAAALITAAITYLAQKGIIPVDSVVGPEMVDTITTGMWVVIMYWMRKITNTAPGEST
jgi:hypothetical protein